MSTDNKITKIIILGVASTSIQAAENIRLVVNHDSVLTNKKESNSSKKSTNKIVEIQGLKRWMTDDKSINDLDLDPIKFKLIHEDNVSDLTLEKADEIGEKYRAFLYLSKKYPNKKIVPSKEVDTFWHAHILDTYKYKEDSEKIFGSFFHHYPYFGVKNDQDKTDLENSFDDTLELYKKEFPSVFSKHMVDQRALCIGEDPGTRSTVKAALCIGEDPGTRSTSKAALCIGEDPGTRSTAKAALCIGENPDTRSHINIDLKEEDGSSVRFENRTRPHFDRINGTIIFK